MKTLFTAATLAAAFALVGCNNNKAHNHDAAPGATSGECCGACSGDAAPGAVSSDAGCASSCSDSAAAPGAVSSEPASCGSSCSDKMEKLGGGCPMSGSKG